MLTQATGLFVLQTSQIFTVKKSLQAMYLALFRKVMEE